VAERLGRIKLTCAEADELAPAFVLGALGADETQSVRDHLADCPNDHREFEELGSVVPALLETVPPVEPRPELGERIMAAARSERASRIEAAWRPSPRPAPTVSRPVATGVRRSPYTWIALAAAAAIVAAALGIWNLQLRSQVDELAAYRTAVGGVLDRAASPGGQVAILAAQGATGGPAGMAGIGGDGSVALAMRDLAPTTGAEVYEVWVIGGDGKPLPVGDFTVAASGTGGTITSIGSTEAGITIALTREPKPGATAPTLPIVALGTATQPGS
jgi:anti-sigma factor RsiW